MNYVRCINNVGNEASLQIGTIYRALDITPTERKSGMIRVVDNEGEDYLYPARWFETVPEEALMAEYSQPLTIHLNEMMKIAIRDMAKTKGVSMSALVRRWIDERLDLPEAA
jgi:hypothetical protein